MNEWPQEALKGGQIIVRLVHLYLDGTGKLWVHTKDIEWLIRSIWINHQLKGVPDVASDDEGPGSGQSSETIYTPEKRQRQLEPEGYLYDKWGEAP